MKKTANYFLSSVAAAALMTFAGCSSDTPALPKIDGFNNSNEVATTNLKAHWTFDDTNNERLSSTPPSNTYGTVGFTTGKIGKALQLTSGALVFPSIANIGSANSLGNFTVSLWVKASNNKSTASAGATAIFALLYADDTDIWGNINMLAETGAHLSTSDTLLLKPLLNNAGNGNLQDNISVVNGSVGKHFLGAKDWAHYVARWNGTTHQFEIFANGVNVGAYNDRGTTPALIMRTPVKAVFGSLSYKDIGFASAPTRGIPLAKASIDDVRVYNTPLADKDITALYKLGLAGR